MQQTHESMDIDVVCRIGFAVLKLAHELASLGSMSVEETSSVMAGVPDCILYLVSSDSADMVG